MNRKIVGIVVAICAVVALISLVGRNRPSGDGNVANVGVILPLTGALSYEGGRMRAAMELAVSELSPDVRSHVKFNYEDGKFMAKDSISAFNKLKLSGMDAWVVFGDTPLLGMKPLLNKDAKPVMCIIGAQNLISDSRWLFQFSGSITLPAKRAAEYASRHGLKKAAVIYLDEQIGQEVRTAFGETFKGQQGTIVHEAGFPMDQRDMKSLCAKVMSFQPDTVFVYGYAAPYVAILNELKRQGYRGVVLTDGNLSAVKSELTDGGEGYIYADFDFGDACENPETRTFIENMSKKHGVSASPFAAFAYETVRVLSRIVSANGKSAEAVHAGLLQVKNYKSIFGEISYHDNRELEIPIIMKESLKSGAKVCQ